MPSKPFLEFIFSSHTKITACKIIELCQLTLPRNGELSCQMTFLHNFTELFFPNFRYTLFLLLLKKGCRQHASGYRIYRSGSYPFWLRLYVPISLYLQVKIYWKTRVLLILPKKVRSQPIYSFVQFNQVTIQITVYTVM